MSDSTQLKLLNSLTILLTITQAVGGSVADVRVCSGGGDCGWNSYCDHGQCWCTSGFQRSDDGQHCLDKMCNVEGCVECFDDSSCKRCVGYLDGGSGRCLDECHKEYTLMVTGDTVGRICQGESRGLSMVYVSIIIAAVSAVLLVILLTLAIYYKIRTDKERDLRLKLMGEFYKQEKQLRSNEITKITELDYYTYGSTDEEYRMKRLHFYHQVSTLRPQVDVFLAMLRDAKLKCRSLGPTDSRLLLYRNLVEQLCRVMTVINDRMTSMPADGNLLLDWANRLLHDYKRVQRHALSPSTGSGGSCWTLPNGFTPNGRLMNGSLPNNHIHRVNHQHAHHVRSGSQPVEENFAVSEISAVHLDDSLSDPIEV